MPVTRCARQMGPIMVKKMIAIAFMAVCSLRHFQHNHARVSRKPLRCFSS